MTSVKRLRRLAGSIVDPRAYSHAFKLLNFYNYSHVQPMREVQLGEQVRISPNATFRHACNVAIGDRTHVGERSCLWAAESGGNITIGKDCLLGPEVVLITTNYQLQGDGVYRDNGTDAAPIVIGNNVWLGARAIVTAGVRIGDNAVIGAGAVVTHDVSAGTVVVGVPARVVRD